MLEQVKPEGLQKTKYYKVLGVTFQGKDAPRRAHFSWADWPAIGQWTVRQDIFPCEQGYHLCELQDITKWMYYGSYLYEVEVAPGSLIVRHGNTKTVVNQARLIRKVGDITAEVKGKFSKWAEETLQALYAKHRPHHYPHRYPECLSSIAHGASFCYDYDLESRFTQLDCIPTGDLDRWRLEGALLLMQLFQVQRSKARSEWGNKDV